ncbi:helix-turn-helix domain-containing protein [Microbulbifer thermotolerans]|uniref:helix-turn-helix domain-containing protein n=1 Tax=Microbulbifer thermotolerans TaxID=252514 RepID=UPI00224B64A9|nr:ImmA/IrrE family metallo-endopeptidase [Microbulbifer thermotolerans]MCX2778350.1 ImmA/IrrE family metallo-endopeptidase [Microbulbifer thermotolerans]MCX2804389.1 ImmA/IrrE family metallo-endopeptidase [Microbulbifer thermotolerans]
MFNSTHLALARKRRGLTKRALAKEVGVTDRSITAYESGQTVPENQPVEKIANALRSPVEFFFADDVEALPVEVASFRALTKMTAAQRDIALSAGPIALLLNQWIESKFDLPAPDFPEDYRISLDERSKTDKGQQSSEGDQNPSGSQSNDPEAAAEMLRRYWDLGGLPIKNMIALLDAKGVRVFSLSVDAREVDAFSMWYGDIPFVFLNTKKTAERCRFGAAHELGHLVMHRHGAPQGQEAEKEANAFTSAFLMPRRSVLANAPRSATLKSLISHKKYWDVSAAALNYRLHSPNLTTDWTYRTLCIDLAKLGRGHEPEPSPFETSQVLKKVFASLREDGISKADVERELLIKPEELDELTFGLMLNVLSGKSHGNLSQNKRPSLKLVT